MRSWPRRFGAHDTTLDVAHGAILRALAPGYDVAEDTALWRETRAEALALAIVWRTNRRSANQIIPARMLELVRLWELAMGLRPVPGDGGGARRGAIAARLVAAAGNTLNDIATIAVTIMGPNFVALLKPDTIVSYWPGVNPGPPGYEFTSNHAVICVQLRRSGLTDAAFERKHRDLVDQLARITPSWMRILTGEGDSFTCDIGICDVTII